jgi:hypothetical protein
MKLINIFLTLFLSINFYIPSVEGQITASLQSSIGMVDIHSKYALGSPIRWSKKNSYDRILIQTNELHLGIVALNDFHVEIKNGLRFFEFAFRDKQQQESYSWIERTADYRLYKVGLISGIGMSYYGWQFGKRRLVPFVCPFMTLEVYNGADFTEEVRSYLNPEKPEKFRYRHYEAGLQAISMQLNIQAGLRYIFPFNGHHMYIFTAAEGIQFDTEFFFENINWIENMVLGLQCGVGVQFGQK